MAGRTASNQLGDHLLKELNAAQLELEGTPPYPFFLELYASGIAPASGFNGFELPADFIVEHEDRPMTWTSDSGTKTDLVKKPFEELIQLFDGDGSAPKYYAIVGGTDVYTFPYVNTGTYALRYYGHMAQTSGENLNTTNKWWRFAPFLLIAKAGLSYSLHTLKDQELAQAFQLDLQNASANLLALNTQQLIAKFDAGAQFLRNS